MKDDSRSCGEVGSNDLHTGVENVLRVDSFGGSNFGLLVGRMNNRNYLL